MCSHHSRTPHLHLRETVDNARYYVSDGEDEVCFSFENQELFYPGELKAVDALPGCRSTLLNLGVNRSALNVMTALAENQGNLDALHIRGESYLTFGMLQWNVGSGSDPGPLAALTARVKEEDPLVFETYFGRFGLDVHSPDSRSNGKPGHLHYSQPGHRSYSQPGHRVGYFSLNGEVLKLPGAKNRLRSLEWGFQFWKSCRETLVRAVQFQCLLDRIHSFYFSRNCAVAGFFIGALITSQYGTALVLDHHISRPGHLKPCLEEALKQAKLSPPDFWGSEEEMRLIDAYLAVRAEYGKYPMPEAEKRADVIKKYLENGTVSAERDSFVHAGSNEEDGLRR